MKALLIYPPFVMHYRPYPSLPALGAFLRERGYQVELRDENMEFLNYYVQPSHFKRICQTLQGYQDKLHKMEFSAYAAEIGNGLDTLFKNEQLSDAAMDDLALSVTTLRDPMLNSNRFNLLHAQDTLCSAHTLLYRFICIEQLLKRTDQESFFEVRWETIKRELKADSEYRYYFKSMTVPKMITFSPDLIGISIAFDDQIIPAFILAHELRQTPQTKHAHITIGGTAVTILQEVIRKHPEVFSVIDSCVLYEGEDALAKLLEALRLGRGLDGVPNLMYMRDAKVITNPIEMIHDLNRLPTPDYDGLPLEKYFSPDLAPTLSTTRGCYWNKCSFCNNRFLNNNATYRMRAPEFIFEDFVTLRKKYNVKTISLWEEAAVPKCLKKLAERIKASEYDFTWFVEARLDKTFTEDFCRLLYEGGCRSITFGLESGNSRVQTLMNKGLNLEVCREVIRNCYRAKLQVYLMVMVGFPGERADEAMDTLHFLEDNRRYIHFAEVSHFVLRRYTPTYCNPERFGISFEHNDDLFAATGSLDYRVTNEGMKIEESLQLCKFIRQRVYNLGLRNRWDTTARKIYPAVGV